MTLMTISLQLQKNKRHVFIREQHDYDDNDTVDESAYDIYAPVSLLLANTTERQNKGFNRSNRNQSVRMPHAP